MVSATPDPRMLSLAAAVGRPVTLAGERLLAVPDALAGLLPDGGLRRGSTVSLGAGEGPGMTSLALALTVSVTRGGSWVGVVGLPSLGLAAAAQMGAALDRVAIVPSAGDQWPVVAAALLDSVDLLLLAPAGRVRAGDARRLTARARERGAVLVVVPPAGMRAGSWPEPADLHLTVEAARWEGLEAGAGHLQSRVLDVVVTGRRAAGRPRRGRIWLPGRDGGISVVQPATGAEVAAGDGVAAGGGVAAVVGVPAVGEISAGVGAAPADVVAPVPMLAG
jgi:hypothetical protein